MATKSSTQPAKSKLTTSQAEGVHSQVTPTTSTTTLPSPTVANGGLAELAPRLHGGVQEEVGGRKEE